LAIFVWHVASYGKYFAESIERRRLRVSIARSAKISRGSCASLAIDHALRLVSHLLRVIQTYGRFLPVAVPTVEPIGSTAPLVTTVQAWSWQNCTTGGRQHC